MDVMDNERMARELGGRRGMIGYVNVMNKKRWGLQRKLVEGEKG